VEGEEHSTCRWSHPGDPELRFLCLSARYWRTCGVFCPAGGHPSTAEPAASMNCFSDISQAIQLCATGHAISLRRSHMSPHTHGIPKAEVPPEPLDSL